MGSWPASSDRRARPTAHTPRPGAAYTRGRGPRPGASSTCLAARTARRTADTAHRPPGCSACSGGPSHRACSRRRADTARRSESKRHCPRPGRRRSHRPQRDTYTALPRRPLREDQAATHVASPGPQARPGPSAGGPGRPQARCPCPRRAPAPRLTALPQAALAPSTQATSRRPTPPRRPPARPRRLAGSPVVSSSLRRPRPPGTHLAKASRQRA